MVLILYYDLLSAPCRTLYLLLKLNGIPFEAKAVQLRTGEHKQPEYLAKNPQHIFPFIEDTDESLILTESVAISKYICDKYKVDDHWYPRDLVKRAKVDEYCAWHHFNTRWKCRRVFRNEVVAPGSFESHGDIVKEMNDMFNVMETVFLKDKSFLTGSEISISDLLAVCEIKQACATGRDVLEDNKNDKLIAWMDKVTNATNPHFSEANGPIDGIRKMILQKKSQKSS